MKLQLWKRFENVLHNGKRKKIIKKVPKTQDLNNYFSDMDVNT